MTPSHDEPVLNAIPPDRIGPRENLKAMGIPPLGAPPIPRAQKCAMSPSSVPFLKFAA
jgi:hypothetical protein